MTLIKCKPHRHPMSANIDRLWNAHHKGHEGQCTRDSESCNWTPRVDILEGSTEYRIVVELPGFSKEDVKLKVEDQVLSLSGERKREEESDDRNYRRVERLYGNFERSFRLPRETEADKISAEMNDGLLTVTIAKSEKVAGREIQVN